MKLKKKNNQYCFEHGLLVMAGTIGTEYGIRGDALIITPPLTVTEQEFEKAIAILRDAIFNVYETIK